MESAMENSRADLPAQPEKFYRPDHEAEADLGNSLKLRSTHP